MEPLPTNKNLNDLDELLQHEEAELGKEDLIYLMEEILKYPKMGAIHKKVEAKLKEAEVAHRGIFLLPRGHLKTTEITISYVIQRLLRDPNLRVLITNERLDNARSFLREIKGHFEKNEALRFLYGDQVNSDEKWTETQIVLSGRKKNIKEPSIQVGSLDVSLTSQHYDLIIADDLVSRNNIGTKEQMMKPKQYWKDLQSLLEPDGTIIVVGTRWNFDDLYGDLLKLDGFVRMIVGCYDENGLPIFPEKYTLQNLQDKAKEIGSYDFSCLYLNNPVDDANADFKRSWFENRFKESDLVGKPMNIFVTMDNAPSTKKGTDFIGIVVNAVDEHNRWHLIWVERFKGKTPNLINKIFELYNKFKPVKIGIEQKAFEDLIKPFLDAESRRRKEFPFVEELKDKGVRKEDRIRGRLQGRFESKSIFIKENPDDDTEALVDEAVRFPRGQYDDLLDALQYQDEIAYRPNSQDEDSNEDDGLYGKQTFE